MVCTVILEAVGATITKANLERRDRNRIPNDLIYVVFIVTLNLFAGNSINDDKFKLVCNCTDYTILAIYVQERRISGDLKLVDAKQLHRI